MEDLTELSRSGQDDYTDIDQQQQLHREVQMLPAGVDDYPSLYLPGRENYNLPHLQQVESERELRDTLLNAYHTLILGAQSQAEAQAGPMSSASSSDRTSRFQCRYCSNTYKQNSGRLRHERNAHMPLLEQEGLTGRGNTIRRKRTS